MNIESILIPERTRCNIEVGSKKKAIEEVARLIGTTISQVSDSKIYENLINREKLGPTAIGHGIAIPHCRLAECHETIGGLFKLKTPVDFGALDKEPVSILFVLLVPEEEIDDHLETLAMLAQRFDSPSYRANLLAAEEDRSLYDRAIEDPLPDTRSA